MNFKIGDKVRFLNEKGEGVVSKIINKNTVGVSIEDGFVIPFTIGELVLIHDEEKTGSVKVTVPTYELPISEKRVITSASSSQQKKERQGVYIAFSPENAENIAYSAFNAWLINHTPYDVLYTYSLYKNGTYITLEKGEIKKREVLLLETIERTALSDFSTFKIDAVFFNENEHEYLSPMSELVKLKPIKLYKDNAFVENNFIEEKALVMNVCFTDESDVVEEKRYISPLDLNKILFQKKNAVSFSKQSKPNVVNDPNYEWEIDLHIEELMDNYSGMSNAEIIQYQLKHFQNAVDTSISNHYRKLFVIHGVGNGRLKQEILAILATYKNLRYHDASYSKYGFGATEIVFF